MVDIVTQVESENVLLKEANNSNPTNDNPVTPEVDPLDELKDIDFLLEDIEDKIAPLALYSAA